MALIFEKFYQIGSSGPGLTRAAGLGPNPDLDGAFRTAKSERAGALICLPGPVLTLHRKRVADLAAKSRLLAIYTSEFVDVGGLMSYDRTMMTCTGVLPPRWIKILKGAKPADLPVEQPTKFVHEAYAQLLEEMEQSMLDRLLALTEDERSHEPRALSLPVRRHGSSLAVLADDLERCRRESMRIFGCFAVFDCLAAGTVKWPFDVVKPPVDVGQQIQRSDIVADALVDV